MYSDDEINFVTIILEARPQATQSYKCPVSEVNEGQCIEKVVPQQLWK